MLFNSIHFAYFFVIVTSLFFLLPHRYRWLLLLLTSCYFYMAFIPIYILILLFTIVVDYVAGVSIEAATDNKRKKFLLVASIIANVGVLALFKYFNFFNENFAALATALGLTYPIQELSIILPIGLSFHTFQSLSYTIEVYRGHQKAERHFGIFALYVMFYPQLVAGPIERPQNVLHQFHEVQRFDYHRFASGLRLIAWGLFKKMVIADQLAIFVNQVYSAPTAYTGLPLILATYAFAIEIYCDFSGYSDIAVGCARVMGFRLMENFRQPYLATSISDFWRRWHISLSTWFRDYLYIPLGGNRVSTGQWAFNTMVVFMVSGLWHGANWTFIIWGALHGIYMILWTVATPPVERRLTAWKLDRIPGLLPALGLFITFNLVSVAWIFFRAQSFADGWYILTHLFAGFSLTVNYSIGIGATTALVVLLSIALMELYEWLRNRGKITFALWPWWSRWACYYALVLLILLFGALHSHAQFIYFQF